jgi:NRPS condensation-like uncharacterized protein
MDYTAEIFDQIQLLFAITGFNDHQLHCVLRFGAKLDAAALKKAVACSIEAIPILGTRYIETGCQILISDLKLKYSFKWYK